MRTSGLTGRPGRPMYSSVAWCESNSGEPATGRHRRVRLAQTAGGGIARIDEHAQSRRLVLAVEVLEDRGRHVDLAADVDHIGRPTLDLGERAGDLGARAHVGGDVLVDAAVAAGGGRDQSTVLVAQVERQPVELELGNEARRGPAESANDPLGPRLE